MWKALIGIVVAAGIGFGVWKVLPGSEGLSLPTGVTRDEYQRVSTAWERDYKKKPTAADVLYRIGDAASKEEDKNWEKILACLERVPDDHRYAPAARFQCGDAAVHLNLPTQAEEHFKRLLAMEQKQPRLRPERLDYARQQLRHVYEIQLRFEERRELLRPMIAAGGGDIIDKMLYCFSSLLRNNGPDAINWCRKFHEADPNNLPTRIALARYETSVGQYREAKALLDTLVAEHPKNIHVITALADYFRERGDWKAIEDIVKPLETVDADTPWHLMVIRGELALQKKNYNEAERCFHTRLKEDPSCKEAWMGLGSVYRKRKAPGDAEKRKVAEKTKLDLAAMQNLLGWGQTNKNDITPFLRLATICERLELYDEAFLMYQHAALVQRDSAEATAGVNRVAAKVSIALRTGGNRR